MDNTRKEYMKDYRENNREKIAEQKKEWYKENKEKVLEQKKEYYKTDSYKKSYSILNWKSGGVINDDFDVLYEKYINCKNCELCNVELVEGRYGSNRRCLDHDHETGLFRNILCMKCNIKIG